ncbi:MAG: tol-pal system protein YbgF [Alphaproteobacteria bacterium]
MTKPFLTALALSLASLIAAGPVAAQLDPLTDPLPRALGESNDRRLDRMEQTLREMRTILFQGRDTGRPVVVQPAETQGQVSTLDTRIADLQETLKRLNSQIDSLSTDISALRRDATADAAAMTSLRQTNAALSARLDGIDKSSAALTKANADRAAADAAAEQARAADPLIQYSQGMQLYIDGRYSEAAGAFRGFLAAHPNDPNAAQANYQLGEALFKQADYINAAQAYIASIAGWPTTSWAPDAMIKLGNSLIELKRNPDACDVLGQFDQHYPTATTALKTQARAARTRARCT